LRFLFDHQLFEFGSQVVAPHQKAILAAFRSTASWPIWSERYTVRCDLIL
jgi:hypothetical protein